MFKKRDRSDAVQAEAVQMEADQAGGIQTEEVQADEAQAEAAQMDEAQADAVQMDASEKRYVNMRTVIAAVISVAVIAAATLVIAAARFRLTREQIFDTNRVRIDTVIRALETGGMENDELIDEYDQLYIAKLKNTWFYYDDLGSVSFDDGFARDAAEYAGVEAAAVIDGDGNAYAAYNCDYDFTRKRFRMLREGLKEDGTSEPFSIYYEESVKRFYGIRLHSGRILVFVVDWTGTERNIETMTSWEAVLRGMAGVDTVSFAVSLQDYSFLYNPIDDLTGRDALQNGVPIEALGETYEGILTFGGGRLVRGRKAVERCRRVCSDKDDHGSDQ